MERWLFELLLDWPFLLFVVLMVGMFLFRSKLQELEIGKSGVKFKIGIRDVGVTELDEVITERLQELQEEIEALKSADYSGYQENDDDGDLVNGIPRGLYELMEARVYPMLNSKLWMARFVDTISKNISVPEETVRAFCDHKPDITLYRRKNDDRWVAGLTHRMEKGGYQKFLESKY